MERQSGFLEPNNAERLLELINSPPPIIPDEEETNFKWNFSTSSTVSLSESLTVPSRKVKRRTNEYVKVNKTKIKFSLRPPGKK